MRDAESEIQSKFGLAIILLMAVFSLILLLFVIGLVRPIISAALMMLVTIALAVSLCVYFSRAKGTKKRDL